MSVSSDAILFYGILIDEGSDDHDTLYNLSYKETNDIEKQTNITVGTHCSSEYPMYFLSKVCYTSYRGDSTIISPENLVLNYDDEFRIACDILKIKYQAPKWYLVSYWG